MKIIPVWIFSLTLAFYLGGFFTEKNSSATGDKYSTEGSQNNKQSKVDTTIAQSTKLTSSSTSLTPKSETRESQFSIDATPPLPPNLIRIMEGAGIIERMGAYLDAVRAMDRTNVQDVVAAFEALPKGYGRHLEMKLLMRSWAAIDPISALKYANDALDEKSERRFGVSEILAGWANEDPNAALEWANTNHSGENPGDNPLLVGIIKGLAESDLDSANDIFFSLPQGNARWQASAFLAQKYSSEGTQEAIAWANRLPSEDNRLKESIFGQLGSRLARNDISGTADWAKSLDHDRASQRVMDNLLTHWVSQSPDDASKWVTTLENQDKKNYAMKQLTSRWSLVDPVATAEWLNTFPASRELDPVVGEFVNRIAGRDPEGAVGWAQSIIDPENKRKALKKALQSWERVSPEDAKRWKSQNGIDQ